MQEPLIKRIFQSAELYPKQNALWINNRHYSYEELAQIILSIYQKIPTAKVYTQIGIYCNDDVATYAAILAVGLYGAAYVPLNNKFPISRNKKIVEQCELNLILNSVENKNLNEAFNDVEIVNCYTEFDNVDSSIIKRIADNTDSYKKTNQPIAYILFTSGSTGQPKGVLISHSNLHYFFDFFLTNYDFNSADNFLQVYELTFDVSVFSFYMPLLVGACCYVVPNDGIKFVKTFQLLKEQEITVVSMVPSILQYSKKYLDELTFEKLRYSFFSGDALYHDIASKWKKVIPNAEIHNFYGPTETTIVCTHYAWNELQSAKESVNGIVPLGKPFQGMKMLIVDENKQPTEKGELCFSGTQVISNYLNDDNPSNFFTHQNEIYYKTGDLVSINSNDNLIFHGRIDTQVKINGYRVELTEIELTITKLTNSRCIAQCYTDENNVNKLIAYIETNELNNNKLKEELSLVLPEYMIPKEFISITTFPLNINGKVDKNKLLNLRG